LDDEGNEIEEENPEAEMDPEELAKKYARKFQSHIYPDSFILLRGLDDNLRRRAESLKKEDNTKWDSENLERRLHIYKELNDISLFTKAN